MRIAITGHRGLPADTMRLIDDALHGELRQHDPADLVGISCLADGADQLFARAVLELGGTLEAIIPAEQYRDGLPSESHAEYDALFARTATVHRLDHVESTSESHMQASELMLTKADRLVAVWDGQPARGFGGTADVVQAAHDRGIPVIVVWPDGARRD